MLSICHFICEGADLTGIEIEKGFDLSDSDKKKLHQLFKEFTDSQLELDREWESLFVNPLGSDPINETLGNWKKLGHILLYILRKNGEIIGFCTVKTKYPMLKDSILIHYLSISKEYRGSGFGRYFLNYVMNDLKKTYPNKNVIINVFDRNEPAKKLYSSLGFRVGSLVMLNKSGRG